MYNWKYDYAREGTSLVDLLRAMKRDMAHALFPRLRAFKSESASLTYDRH